MSEKIIVPFIPQTAAVCPHKRKIIEEKLAQIRAKEELEEKEKRSLQLENLKVKTQGK